jgi:hypothetical protein
MHDKKTYSFQTARNETDLNASVPEGWRQEFRPIKPKKEFQVPAWLAVVVLALLAASIVILANRDQINGTLGSIAGLIIVGIALLSITAIGFLLYSLPSIVAFRRRHRSRGAICACNFLFGWTFLGWGITLVWSLTSNVEE